jgi:hypothetical protein
MGKYDAIRGAGNVTVQAPPDFWTAAKQSFDDDYDRLVEAQERKKEEERYNSETAKEVQRYNEQTSTERRRYLEQQEQIKKAQDRQDWQYMYEGAKTDSQRAIIYANGLKNNVSGLTAAGLDAINEASSTETSLNIASQNYYAGDDLYRHENGAKLISDLIRNNKHSEAALIEQNMKESRKNVENKETFDMVVSQYPSVFTDDLKGLFKNVGDMSDTQLNMASTILDNNLKKSLADDKQKRDLYESLIKIGADAEFPNEISRNAAQLGFLGLQSLDAGDTVTTETKDINLSLEDFDQYLTGKDKSYDENVSEERKEKIFNNVVKAYQKEWDAADEAGRRVIGQKIIDEINKTSYDPDIKVATFSGGEISDPEYEGVESLTEKVINDKIQEIYKRKGFNTKKKLSMMSASMKKDSRTQAINELLSEKRHESKRKSKKIAREINKEMAERKRQEELMYGADWNI